MPVVADDAEPVVVAVASTVGPAPWVALTVNWSAAFARAVTDLVRVRCGLALFVKVQVMLSPLAGVTVNEVPEPLGNTVPEEPAVFEQLIELRYEPIAEAEPPAIVSVRV